MTSRLSALLVWGLAAASVVFWAMRLSGASTPVPPQAQIAQLGGTPAGDLSRLLGTAPVAARPAGPVVPPVASRFVLTGVVATRTSPGPGIALLAIDGKPARAYRVGEPVDASLVLRAVSQRSARIGGAEGGGEFVLELPRPAPPATGVPGSAGATVGMVPAPPGAPSLPQGLQPGSIVPDQAPTNVVMPGAPGQPTMSRSDLLR